MLSKVKSAVIVTATVIAVIAVSYRIPGLKDVLTVGRGLKPSFWSVNTAAGKSSQALTINTPTPISLNPPARPADNAGFSGARLFWKPISSF